MTRWLEASKSINKSTQVEIYGVKGFLTCADHVLTTGELGRRAFGDLGH